MRGHILIILSAISAAFMRVKSASDDECWFDESQSDKKCCQSTTLEVESVDKDGHLWAYENGTLCAIKEPKCFSLFSGYPCCKDKSVVYIDDDGEWGYTNNNWCGVKFKKRWNDRSIIKETSSEWKKFKKDFNDKIYPGLNNSDILNADELAIDHRTQLSMNMGSDESKLNFGWYSLEDGTSKIRILDITDKVPEDINNIYEYSQTLDINDFNMNNATVFSNSPMVYQTEKVNGNLRVVYSNKVTVTGLENRHYYIYQYSLGDNWVIENPPRLYRNICDEDKIKVMIAGDPQLGANYNRIAYSPKYGWVRQNGLDAATNDAFNWRITLKNAYSKHPDLSFLITAGDQIHTSNNEYQQEIEYAAFLSNPYLHGLPLAPTVGNHDHDSGSSNFKYHFNNPNSERNDAGAVNSGSDYYYSRGKSLFIHLNGNNLYIKDHKNTIDKAIAAYPNDVWRIVVIHFDLYGPASHLNESIVKVLRTGLTPVFFEAKIDLVLQGHNHIHARTHLLSQINKCTVDENHLNKQDAKEYLLEADKYVDKCYNVVKPTIKSKRDSKNEKSSAFDVEDADGMGVVQSDSRTKYNNPDGIIFFEASTSSGSAYHTPDSNFLKYIARRGQPLVPLYSIMEVSIDKESGKTSLILDTYKVSDNSKYDNGYIITKDYVETNYEPVAEVVTKKNTKAVPVLTTSSSPITTTTTTTTAIPAITTDATISISTKSVPISPVVTTEDISTTTTTTTITSTSSSEPTCWAEALNHKCCTDPNTPVSYTDSSGKWGRENHEWCGILDTSHCWALDYGFKCCESENVKVVTTDSKGQWGTENGKWCGITPNTSIITTTSTTTLPITTMPTTTTNSTTTTTTSTTTSASEPTCWAEALNYKCCTDPNTPVFYTDSSGKWGRENHEWCGIININRCWALDYGYKCCKGENVKVVATDSEGQWGMEDGKWCGIVSNTSTTTTTTTTTTTESTKSTKSVPITTTTTTTTTTSTSTTTTTTTTTTTSSLQPTCWAEAMNYKCCTDPNTPVMMTDSLGKWGIENGTWCGIINNCWALNYGYKCCQDENVKVIYTDSKGQWGIENNYWCGIVPKTSTTTTKSTKTTTTTTTTTSPTSTPQKCSKVFDQCGGADFRGPTCCEPGTTCVYVVEYYSQCVPENNNYEQFINEYHNGNPNYQW